MINPVAFSIGDFNIFWYGIIMGLAILIAIWMIMREAPKEGISDDLVSDMAIGLLIIAFICARIYYVVFQWDYYRNHLNEILAFHQGGIAIYGGLLGGLAVVIWFTKKHNIPTFKMLDVMTPAILTAQMIGRFGNFVNHEAFGRVVSKEFLEGLHVPQFIIQNMLIDGSYREPTFLYESIWSLIGVIFLLSLRHRKHFFLQGEITFTYVIWYGIGRFFIEGLRSDSLYLVEGVRVSQLVSLILVIGSIIWMIIRRQNKNKINYYIE